MALEYRIYGIPNCTMPSISSNNQSFEPGTDCNIKGSPMKAVNMFPRKTDSIGDPSFCMRMKCEA